MDAKTSIISFPNFPKIALTHVRSWDTKSDILLKHLMQTLDTVSGPTMTIVDAPIGGGKTELMRYLTGGKVPEYEVGISKSDKCKFFSRPEALQLKALESGSMFITEPIADIRKITTKYYAGALTIGQVNDEICSLCESDWTKFRSIHTKASLFIEHLPNPVHHWLFEKDFSTSLSIERTAMTKVLGGAKYVDDLMREPLILRALRRIPSPPELFQVIIVMPDPDTVFKQIAMRGRGEEKVLSEQFIKYQCTKFDRLLWEMHDRSKADIEKNIQELGLRFPHLL
jgi:hypothetical protein